MRTLAVAPPVVVRAPALFLSPLLSETHPGSYFFSLAFIIFLLLPASASRIVYSCPFRFCSFVLEEKRAEPRGYLFNYHYLLFINNPIVPNDLHWLPCTCLRSSSRLKPPKESSARRFLAPLAVAFSTQNKLKKQILDRIADIVDRLKRKKTMASSQMANNGIYPESYHSRKN